MIAYMIAYFVAGIIFTAWATKDIDGRVPLWDWVQGAVLWPAMIIAVVLIYYRSGRP